MRPPPSSRYPTQGELFWSREILSTSYGHDYAAVVEAAAPFFPNARWVVRGADTFFGEVPRRIGMMETGRAVGVDELLGVLRTHGREQFERLAVLAVDVESPWYRPGAKLFDGLGRPEPHVLFACRHVAEIFMHVDAHGPDVLHAVGEALEARSAAPGPAPHGSDPVHVIHSSTANTASVVAALTRCGAEVVLTEDRGAIERAERLVLPGVGSFGHIMEQLHGLGVVEILRERVRGERPTFGICLGMQVLFESSEESPGVAGLGVAPGDVTRFRDEAGDTAALRGEDAASGGTQRQGLRIPQFGWNAIAADAGCRVLADGAVYFANSYRATDVGALRAAGWRVATADHGGRFVAAVERGEGGAVAACQFHPELSGAFGTGLLKRWLAVRAQQRSGSAAQRIGAAE